MRDIAQRLSISTVTVSKALGEKDGVSESLRGTIKQLASEMGYSYTSLSESEELLKNYNIGIIVASNYMQEGTYPFYFKMYQSIVRYLSSHKYSGILELITPLMREKNILPNIASGKKVDGIIVMGQLESEYLELLKGKKIPLIYLDFYDKNEQEDSVITDNVHASYLLTNYIVEMGHEKIAFVGNIYATSSILDRYLGYYRSLLLNGIAVREDYLISDRGEDELFIDLKLPEDMPTAFVCNCDEIAYILMEKLKKDGYRIPEDISVVGFDNYTLAGYTSPKLTTVEVNIEAMTKSAVELLVEQIEGRSAEKGRRLVSGKLIIRDSVAKHEKKF
ncbi:MAG: LacI family DNA-binding transcriptional regulator [Lachnospiraceae bacterium]|nr:LacI family DNA-binding transcriptional regulator [Lachnospiraceae bacterium]